MNGPKDYCTEWSEPDKDIYHMISFIYGIEKKKGTNKLIYKTESHIGKKLMVNRGKRTGINWDISIDIYTLLYITQ